MDIACVWPNMGVPLSNFRQIFHRLFAIRCERTLSTEQRIPLLYGVRRYLNGYLRVSVRLPRDAISR